MTRDFTGYGAEPPHAGWPGGARIAVNFVINFEEGSELSYPAGDGVSESLLTEMGGGDLGIKGRDLRSEERRVGKEGCSSNTAPGSASGGCTGSSPGLVCR